MSEEYDEVDVQEEDQETVETSKSTKGAKDTKPARGGKNARGGRGGRGGSRGGGRGGSQSSSAQRKQIAAMTKSIANMSLADIASQESKSTDGKTESYRNCTGVLISDPMSKDVKIGGFTLTAWSKELISDSTLEFTIGRRYGLIGANGSGKTTLLKAIANREIPIPEHIDIYLLEEEAPPTDKTALEWIVSQVQDEIKRLEKLAEDLCEHYGPESPELENVYSAIDRLEGLNPETHAALLLRGLGFGPKMMAKATKDMSGGWRMRVSLAKALFVRPTLLLLDEPTNHLDLEACVWLENHLSNYDKCLMITSHSQDFLNGVCTNIIELNHKQKLTYWSGNYDTYVKTKEEVETNQLRRYEKQQEEIKAIKAFIASCGTYANLVRQAQSRQKVLDKMIADGLVEKPTPPPKFNFRFAACEKLAPPVMQFHGVGFAYSGKVEDMLYRNVNLAVDNDSRVALVGPNGAGKSTLLKLMVDEIQPTEGEIRRHLHMKIGRYHQHITSELNPEMTPLDYVQARFPEQKMDEEEWRRLIGRYGISGTLQKTKIGHMSDGQKSRLAFCILAIEQPNILLLDEPTNHLDMQCIDALADAINNFQGGVVLVSHDFRLISQVAKEIWLCDNGTVSTFKGDIRAYKKWLIDQVASKNQETMKLK